MIRNHLHNTQACKIYYSYLAAALIFKIGNAFFFCSLSLKKRLLSGIFEIYIKKYFSEDHIANIFLQSFRRKCKAWIKVSDSQILKYVRVGLWERDGAYMCVYFIYICIYTHTRVYVYMHTYTQVFLFLCVCVCMYIYIYIYGNSFDFHAKISVNFIQKKKQTPKVGIFLPVFLHLNFEILRRRYYLTCREKFEGSKLKKNLGNILPSRILKMQCLSSLESLINHNIFFI